MMEKKEQSCITFEVNVPSSIDFLSTPTSGKVGNMQLGRDG